MNNLVERIKELQSEKQLTDEDLANLLQIHRTTWSKIKSGKRNPGMKFIRAVNNKLTPVEISDIIATTPHQTTQNRHTQEFLGEIGKTILKMLKRLFHIGGTH